MDHKARWLLDAGAHVIMVSPSFSSDFEGLSGIEKRERKFEVKDLEGVRLAISATGDPETNSVFCETCRKSGVLHCVTDEPEWCEFISATVIERGDLTVAISSGGTAPALTKRLRRELEEWLPRGFEEYLSFLRSGRDLAKERISDPELRSRVSTHLASRDGYEKFMRLDPDQQQAWLNELLTKAETS